MSVPLHLLFVLCAVIGAWVVWQRVLWPVAEAIIYACVLHLMELAHVRVTWAGWRTVVIALPLFAFYVAVNPWRHAWRRLFGPDAYVSEITVGRWTFCPPFYIKHNKEITDKEGGQ